MMSLSGDTQADTQVILKLLTKRQDIWTTY